MRVGGTLGLPSPPCHGEMLIKFLVAFVLSSCLGRRVWPGGGTMVHNHSPLKLVERRAIAAERGYLSQVPTGKTHLLVDARLKPRLKMMRKD